MKKRVMNLVNFVRGCEPREPWQDLYTPVVEEIKINKQYGFENTFLLQYDALIRKDFRELFAAEKDEHMEIGLWFEMGRPLTEAVGIEWRGRPGYDWDWFVDPGFLPAYTNEEREKLIDEAFRLFREIFGYYPKVAGSWLLDAYSIDYMSKKYDLDAVCICREQHAVDAYTLWGGYYNGGYYASKNNMLCPATREENRVPTPVFRMLGIDPVYGYDEHKYSKTLCGCPTMEPVWTSGGNADIMDWYFRTYYQKPCLEFSHATTGQENSFGWNNIKRGYPMQAEKLNDLQKKGIVTVEKLGDTGRAMKAAGPRTPTSAMVATDTWDGNNIQSVWYSCAHYRANLFCNDGHLFFRDINKFDDRYEERYLHTPCRAWDATFDNLPVVDGRLWSKDDRECELAFGAPVAGFTFVERGETLEITVCFKNGCHGLLLLTPGGIVAKGCGALTYRPGTPDAEIALTDGGFDMKHNGYAYRIGVKGAIRTVEDGYVLEGAGGVVEMDMTIQ